jgi:hypothetical protein
LVVIGFFLEHIISFFGEFVHSSVVLLYVFSGVKDAVTIRFQNTFFISVVILKKKTESLTLKRFSSYDLIFILIFSLFITLSICSGMGSLHSKRVLLHQKFNWVSGFQENSIAFG